MSENDKRPNKIDIEELLGDESSDAYDTGEIEVLDPGPLHDGNDRPITESAEEAFVLDDEGDEEISTTGEPLRASTDQEGSSEEYYDLYVRTRADFENFRKRVEREKAGVEAQAGAFLVKDLLPVLDNLNRALRSAPPDEPFMQGIDLIYKQLVESLVNAGLETIEAVGEPFDPVYHEAVATVETKDAAPNTVIDEMLKGYKFRGRVIRPTMVRVSIAPGQVSTQDLSGENS